jgi:hypothetical protein
MSGSSDYTTTPNLGLYKPNYNADVDHWADHLNTNADILDETVHTIQTTYLPLAGGTLTGALVLPGNPAAALAAVPKQYVDAGIALLGNYLPLAGGTLTGQLILAGNPAAALGAAPKQYVDALGTSVAATYLPLAGGTLSGGLHFGNAVAPGGVTDLSRHLDLNNGTFGLSITSARLNVVIPGGSSAFFNAGGTDIVQIQPAGLFMLGGFRIDHGATLGSGVGDVSHHIVLYGGTGASNYGIGVSSGSLNLVSGNNFRFVDSSNANPLLQVNRNTATLFVPLALPADPTTALQAATKQYVDAHVAALQAQIAGNPPAS